MKRLALIIAALSMTACVHSAQPWLAAPAPYSCRIPCDQTKGGYVLHTVQYPCTNITICGLMATVNPVRTNSMCGDPTDYMFSDGEPITRGPDLAGGAWGWPTGRVFAGTAVTVTTNTYNWCGNTPVGYTAVGVASNPATITVGGTSIIVTGKFDRSIGPATNGTSISMTTAGYAAIGITTMCSNEWYGAIDGLGDSTGITDETSINQNSGFLVYRWACTPTTNVVYGRLFKYGGMQCLTNVYHLSHSGYIAAGAQMRVLATLGFSGDGQQYRFFGWRAYYGTLTAEQVLQREVDARAEYTGRGYGQ